MLKDKFNWTIARVEKEYSPFEEHVRIHLDGVNHSKQFITSTNEIELRKEIEAYMNNEPADKTVNYAKYDVDTTLMILKNFAIGNKSPDMIDCHLENYIDKVIFNDPATIVKWKDGTKTVVKVQDGEQFDPMVGLAMCISKKAMGNQGNYFEVFKKYCEPWYREQRVSALNASVFGEGLVEGFLKGIGGCFEIKMDMDKNSPVLAVVKEVKQEDKND